jgi:hypothetical protein
MYLVVHPASGGTLGRPLPEVAMRRLRLRDLTDEERTTVERLAHSRTAPARRVERARIIWRAGQGHDVAEIADQLLLRA